MKQILQNLKTGNLEIAEVPVPQVAPGQLLLQTRRTLISAGTERMLVNFAKSGLLGKAKQQPEKVKQVLDKIKTDGLLPTLHSVFARLDEPLPLGYCNCGVVLEVGTSVKDFQIGDRVISNGPHAEIVSVPKNLCARVPNNVTDDQAAFTVLASIGLQGIRLLQPTFGETVVVTGLGLIGLMCVQMLRSSGCRVIGIDLDKNKLALAEKFGAEVIDVAAGADAVQVAMSLTNGRGVDGVLITASAKEDTIIHQSAEMCRQRGRIVLVGVVNMNMDRSDFYEKELSFQVSCSYGPGRYDPAYEQGGQDYPLGFVRWTEQRNFEAILQQLSSGMLQVDELISDTFPIEKADAAYRMLTDEPSKMALLLTYPEQVPLKKTIIIKSAQAKTAPSGKVVAGLIGAGNFAKLTLLPAIKGASIRLKTVADINGVSGTHAAKKFGFEQASNDYKEILNDPEINTVFITTRHDLHARMVIEALQTGKHVHVEKPLCLSQDQLKEIKQVYAEHSSKQLFVGFNRRFSPHAQKMQELLKVRSTPLMMTCVINAGAIPADVWIQDDAGPVSRSLQCRQP
jgi:threonine dehydrogenase-like Zn-dependent dehydrogenase